MGKIKSFELIIDEDNTTGVNSINIHLDKNKSKTWHDLKEQNTSKRPKKCGNYSKHTEKR